MDLRARIEPAVRQRLSAIIERQGMSENVAVERLVAWFNGQDPLVQAALFGQVEMSEAVMDLLISRLRQSAGFTAGSAAGDSPSGPGARVGGKSAG